MTEFGDALAKAINKSKTDINNLVWKEANGKEVRLMDMDEKQLKKAWHHCDEMLNNKNRWNPGKLVIQQKIQNMYENCNAELFLRYLLYTCKIDFLKTNKDILDLINNARKTNNIQDEDSVSVIFEGLTPVFEKVTIKKLILACLDALEPFDRILISDKFIMAQGIWFTDEEKKDLTEYDENGKLRNRLELVKERLILNNVKLRIDPKGLTYTEFRGLMQLKSRIKLSDLPTNTLQLLRDKVLLLLDNDLNYHIQKWNNIKTNIEKVANYKSITLE